MRGFAHKKSLEKEELESVEADGWQLLHSGSTVVSDVDFFIPSLKEINYMWRMPQVFVNVK